ncbi:MAG: energy-coupling factor transporter transmembrane protein EcfT [Clostridia bacterium]|nr:energy-coupling factor transporter transmembrane protein EcfT [Clostridia bacterium]
MRDVTLGQYFHASSLLHRLDPRIKILSAILLIVGLFSATSLWCYAFLTALVLLLAAISGIPLRMILKSVRPLCFVLVFTSLIAAFMTKGDGDPFFSFLLFSRLRIEMYPEGLIRAALLSLRILLLVIATGLFLTYTTTPTSLTDALERLLHPLTYLKIPVYDFAMMMTIALRFVPTLMEETDRIMCAQKARGADFSSGSLFRRIRALVPIIIPLFVSSFRRAVELATAMECRCYRGGAGRTRLRTMRCRPADWLFLAVAAVCLAAVFVGNAYLPEPSFMRGVL